MMSYPTSERSDGDRSQGQSGRGEAGHSFRRKIDCAEPDSARGDERRASGRGDGVSDLDQWRRQARDARG